MGRVNSCVVSDFSRNSFSFFLFMIMLDTGLAYIFFTMLRYVPSNIILSRMFMKTSWILSEAFSVSIEMIMWLLPLSIFTCFNIFITLLNPPPFSELKPTWLWYTTFLICSYFQLPSILLKIFVPCSSGKSGCSFCFCWNLSG